MNPETGLKGINLNESGINHLKETRAWTNFLSILGFVFLGLMTLIMIIGLIASGFAKQSPYAGIASGFAFLVMALFIALYYFPFYYLLSFSRNAKIAVTNQDPSYLTEALRYLKLHYRFMGILAIVIISLYILAILIVLATAGSLQHFFNT